MKQIRQLPPAARWLRVAGRTARTLLPGRAWWAHAAMSLAICSVSIGFGPMSLGACLLAACAEPYISACAVGALAGYGVFWGFPSAYGPCAVALIALCGRKLLPKGQQTRFLGAICAGSCAVLGVILAAAARFEVPILIGWAANSFAAFFGVGIVRRTLREGSSASQITLGCALLAGLWSIRLPFQTNLAVLALAWMVSAPMGLTCACAGGGTLALLSPACGSYAAAFALAAFVHRGVRRWPLAAQGAVMAAFYSLAGLRIGHYGFTVSALMGCMLAAFVPPMRYLPAPRSAPLPEHPAQRELRQAADGMTLAAQMLAAPIRERPPEMAEIFDHAAEQICKSCAKYNICWKTELDPHYEDLSECARVALPRSRAEPEDLPPRFHARCVHVEAFLTAVNDALEVTRHRRRLQRRLNETRHAAMLQFQTMGSYLEAIAHDLYAPPAPENYAPEVQVQAAGRAGAAISGDRGAAFAGPGGTYYVLLCDGMGTGAAAARESTEAIRLLRQLLVAGVEAAQALRTLNGIYVLRDNGCFSTIDLLRINLTSGDAILYKWGAAPSYLKRSRGLRSLGGSSLPPGLGENEQMQQLHLSLDRESVLILLSDGLGGKESRRRLEACQSLSPRDVANCLFVGRDAPDDDCTAVAIRLHQRKEALLPIA